MFFLFNVFMLMALLSSAYARDSGGPQPHRPISFVPNPHHHVGHPKLSQPPITPDAFELPSFVARKFNPPAPIFNPTAPIVKPPAPIFNPPAPICCNRLNRIGTYSSKPPSSSSSSSSSPSTCPSTMGGCVDVLGGVVEYNGLGNTVENACCPLLQGLVGFDAAMCLCTTMRLKLLNPNRFIPLALQALATCGKSPPPGFTCPRF